ncbi:MAG: aldo/keto reductase [Micavibrio aeruginosavorus]|nr:aldo/keto reductase [Micavibrio aeruginosavorus]
MEFINARGTPIPALGFGTYELTGTACRKAVTAALETGYRHIDTAQIYNNESDVGAGLAESGVKRGDIFLTTKVWMDRVNDGPLQKSVDESLKHLKTDYVDLLLLHWPVPEVPLAEQIKALREVHSAGKARLIGVSNYTVAMLRDVIEEFGAPIVTNQVEYHPFLSQKAILDFLRGNGMFLTAYSPLARGAVRDNSLLNEIGKRYGKTPGQVTLRWLIQQGSVAAIPKAGSPAHIKNNFEIFDFSLSPYEMEKIHALARPDGRLINPGWSPHWDRAA